MTDVDKKTGYFKIIYEDGDNEELQGDELLKLLGKMSRQKKKQPELEVAAIPKAAPRRATQDASTTLHEFVRNAAHAARRKRKHTDMVRRGVFKDREAKERAKEEARQKAETEAAEVEAAAAACRELYPPPAWAVDMDKEQRFLTCDGAAAAYCAPPPTAEEEAATLESMYRLSLEAHSPGTVTVRWWYPPANPGNSSAWVCLWERDEVHWDESGGDCVGRKLQWRLITSNDRHGAMKWTIKGADGQGGFQYPDGQYVFTMQVDYGTRCRAVTDVLELEGCGRRRPRPPPPARAPAPAPHPCCDAFPTRIFNRSGDAMGRLLSE